MPESPGKSAFGVFVPDEGGAGGLIPVGTQSAGLTDEQVRAAEALRAWDTMARGAYPPNTVRAWRADWRSFIQFCADNNENPLPASPPTVRAYAQRCMEAGKKPATIRRYLATIARA